MARAVWNPFEMRGDAPHRVERHRSPDEARVSLAVDVRPWLRDLDRLVERDAGDLGSQATDRVCRNAGLGCDGVGRHPRIQIAFHDELERRDRLTPVGERETAGECGTRARGSDRDHAFRDSFPDQRPPLRVAREKAVVCTPGIVDHQPRCVRVAADIVHVDLAQPKELMDERTDEQPVGPWTNADPVVRDGRVSVRIGFTETNRPPRRFTFAMPSLSGLESWSSATPKRIKSFVLSQSGAPNSQNPPPSVMIPAAAMFTRTEPAMRCVVRRTEHLCPVPRQGLRLVATGKEGQLAGIGLAYGAQPLCGNRQASSQPISTSVPLPRGPTRFNGSLQPRRRIVLHDPGRTLGTEYAAIDRMVAVALDVADLSVLQWTSIPHRHAHM